MELGEVQPVYSDHSPGQERERKGPWSWLTALMIRLLTFISEESGLVFTLFDKLHILVCCGYPQADRC